MLSTNPGSTSERDAALEIHAVSLGPGIAPPEDRLLQPGGASLHRSQASRSGDRRGSQLLQQAQLVRASPAFDHFAILEFRYLHAANLHLPASRGNSHEGACLRPAQSVGE